MVKALKGKYHIPWIGLAYPKITWGSSNFIFRILCNRIQNCAALLVCSEPALSHATSLLHRLHWLVVARRITYKLCVLVFDVFHGTAPTYLTDRSIDSRLRSSSRGNFVVRRTRTRFTDSSFAVAGPAAWNSLPVYIQNIRSHSERSADNLTLLTCLLSLTELHY